MERHTHMLKLVGALSGIAILGAGCAGADSARAADKPVETAISVRLAQVEHGAQKRKLRVAGTLHMKAETDLAFKVGGVVTKVTVDAGSRVRKGQVLALVDPTEAQAAVSQTNQAVEKAERDLERARHLNATGALGTVDVQNAETGVAVAHAAAEASAFNLRHTAIVAPDNGVIDRRLCEVGEIAAPGRPMFHLSGVSRGAIVRAALADREALGLRIGDVAQVRLDAEPDKVLAARVSQFATMASPGTGTIDIELSIDDHIGASLPSGLTAKVEIERIEHPASSVPVSALVDGEGDSAAVYIVDGTRAKRVPVRVSYFSEDRVALASGLEHQAAVIDSGASRLSDGALLRVEP